MRALNLEVFETTELAQQTPVVTLETIAFEEAKLAAYDQGYRAGWDDAVQAQMGDQAQISAELARNLKSLSLTFADARAHVLASMEPLLADIVARLLPEMARDTLGPIIMQTLRPMGEQAAQSPIEIIINPSARPALEALLAQGNSTPVTLTPEPSLGDGQAFCRLGESETRIDLDGAIAEIASALQGFFQLPERNQHHDNG
jgi:flagellar assembly protein FliH